MYRQNNLDCLNDIYAWLLIFFDLYFVYPAFYLEEISVGNFWYFSDYAITLTKLSVIWWWAVIFFYILMSNKATNIKYKGKVKPSETVESRLVVTFLIFYISIYLYFNGSQHFGNLQDIGYDPTDTISQDFRLKTLAYVGVVFASILFAASRNIFSIVLLILIIATDLIQGSRTVAMIAIISLTLILSTYYRYALYLLLPSLISLLLFISYNFRPIYDFDVPFHTLILSEPIQTFLTLPYAINVNLSSKSNPIVSLFVNLIYPFLGPVRVLFEFQDYSHGSYVATEIGRGYGLANNIMYESYLLFSWFGILIMPFILINIISRLRSYIIKRQSDISYFALLIFGVVFLRLILREGVSNITLFIYIYFVAFCLPLNFFKLLKK